MGPQPARPIRRSDYRPPEFRVTSLTLDIALDETATIVKSTMKVERANGAVLPVRLDGRTLELLELKVDGRVLTQSDYQLDGEGVTVPGVRDRATIDITTRINPAANTTLDGLYRSGGMFCTQCEPEGFRKITFYPDRPDVMTPMRVRVEAERDRYPVLLSNGNPVESGAAPNGRHYAVWDDPFPKSSYLFALVAGDLARLDGTFVTRSGRKVALGIYAAAQDLDKLDHAMRSLQAAMEWDERIYGREYQLDVFNIVAVGDFNMGAMENTGLNIFNTKYVLAGPDIATDVDYAQVEGVIGHEYFHNWSGNRVTCRDWFQLSLKEGLTVFRDQQFSADRSGAAIKRIAEVDRLRRSQFPEDSGPMAHPVRPDSYIEINNFYTPTVYEKGAEVVRMIRTLIGPGPFRAGMDLYFDRFDGQAVTCDDFVQAMEDASGVDLTRFRLWYSQAGTPLVAVQGHYDGAAGIYRLTLSQTTPPTADQRYKAPLVIPVATALLAPDGSKLPLGPDQATERVLVLEAPTQTFTFGGPAFEGLARPPVPSLLRGFSAPVRLAGDHAPQELAFLLARDDDPVARWDAGQELAARAMLALTDDPAAADGVTLSDLLVDAFGRMIAEPGLDPGFAATMLVLPDAASLAERVAMVDVDALAGAARRVRVTLATALRAPLLTLHAKTEPSNALPETDLSAGAMGRRALHNAALRLLAAEPDDTVVGLATAQFQAAQCMTLRIGALATLADTESAARMACLDAFYARHHGSPLAVDKWFAVQARADRDAALADVRRLMRHPDFTTGNPNRLRALVGAFADGNFSRFHDRSGEGYALLTDIVAHLDTANPQVGARLLGPLRQWRRFTEPRRGLMERALRSLAERIRSRDIFEVVSKSLGD